VNQKPFYGVFNHGCVMYEIYILLIAVAIGLAKRGRRKFRRYLKGTIRQTISLTTLGAKTLVSQVVDDTVVEKAWLSSVRATWSMDQVTQAAGDGPVLVGIAHSDYTDPEIEAWIENTGSWEEGDQTSQEVARRKIRRVGMIGGAAAGVNTALALNDGKPITTKCGWMLATGQTVRLWAYNTGTSAFAGTVPLVQVEGHANLWPA